MSNFMEHVEILTSINLEAMMKKLRLPCPKYESQAVGGGYFVTKMMSYPSAHFLRTSLHPRSLLSYPEDSLETATEQAVAKTIMSMETAEKKVLKDFNYTALEREKNVNSGLHRQLDAKESKAGKEDQPADRH